MMVVKVTPSDSGREGGSQVRLARPGELRHQGPSLSQTRCCPGVFGGHLSPPEQMAHPDNITCCPHPPVPRAGEGPHRGTLIQVGPLPFPLTQLCKEGPRGGTGGPEWSGVVPQAWAGCPDLSVPGQGSQGSRVSAGRQPGSLAQEAVAVAPGSHRCVSTLAAPMAISCMGSLGTQGSPTSMPCVIPSLGFLGWTQTVGIVASGVGGLGGRRS